MIHAVPPSREAHAGPATRSKSTGLPVSAAIPHVEPAETI